MNSTPPPRRRNQPPRATPTRKQRTRSTIGVNPLDLLPASDSPMPGLASQPATPDVLPTPRPAASHAAPSRTSPESDDVDLDADVDLARAGQRVFAAWVSGTEGVLKALFEAQQSTLRANLSVLEASTSAQHQITHELTAAARQAQAAALRAFHTRIQGASRQ
jgi:hypothetical protein